MEDDQPWSTACCDPRRVEVSSQEQVGELAWCRQCSWSNCVVREGRMARRAERDSVIQRGRIAVAEARALREHNRLARKKADAICKSASSSRLRSGGRAASLIHDLESASHELHMLQSRIDSIIKHNGIAFRRPLSRRFQRQPRNKSHNVT